MNAPRRPGDVERKLDVLGRRQMAHKPSRGAVLARREKVRQLWHAGFGLKRIAEAMGLGESTIADDLDNLGIRNRPRRPSSPPVPRELLASEPLKAPDPRMSWRRSLELRDVSGFLERLRSRNTRASFAALAVDAHQAGDQEWLAQAGTTIREAIAYLHEMEEAAAAATVADRQHRDPAYRDDIGRPPRFEPRVVS